MAAGEGRKGIFVCLVVEGSPVAMAAVSGQPIREQMITGREWQLWLVSGQPIREQMITGRESLSVWLWRAAQQR